MPADKKPPASAKPREAGSGAPPDRVPGEISQEDDRDHRRGHDGAADDKAGDPRFFMVGIGASAGGLEALSALLKDVLVPGGFLLVGTSETVGESTDYFSLVDRTNKLSTRRNVASMAAIELGSGAPGGELQNRMGELQQTDDDLHNILGVIGEAVLIVDIDARIRRFNHLAERLFNLVAGDIGRSVSMVNSFLGGQRMEDLAARVVDRLAPIETRVSASDRKRYLVRVTPYPTSDHSIKGVVSAIVPATPLGAKGSGAGGKRATPPAKGERPAACRRTRAQNGKPERRGRP